MKFAPEREKMEWREIKAKMKLSERIKPITEPARVAFKADEVVADLEYFIMIKPGAKPKPFVEINLDQSPEYEGPSQEAEE